MKTKNILKPTIKRSLAASLLNYSTKTLRRRELEGVLTPIKRNSRSTFYLIEEVEKLRCGEIATPSHVTINLAVSRGADGQFQAAT